MRILHIVWDLGQGGTQTYLYSLLQEFKKHKGVYCEILVLSNEKGYLYNQLLDEGFVIHSLNMSSGRDIIAIFKLYCFLRKIKFDIIHSHSSNRALNLFLNQKRSINIFTEHGGGLIGGVKRDASLYKLFPNNYSKYIAISHEMADLMKSANSKITNRIEVIYNGIDVNKIDKVNIKDKNKFYKNENKKEHLVGIVGRLVEQKGVDIFIDTAQIILKDHPDIKFCIVGDGPLRRSLEEKTNNLNIAESVDFLGYRSDALEIMNTFDIFLFTSIYEPFGLVITEAMALGVPIVALDLKGAVSEILDDSRNGFVIRKKNTDELAGKVIQLLLDETLKKCFIQKARRKVENEFTMEKNSNAIIHLYKDCILNKNQIM